MTIQVFPKGEPFVVVFTSGILAFVRSNMSLSVFAKKEYKLEYLIICNNLLEEVDTRKGHSARDTNILLYG